GVKLPDGTPLDKPFQVQGNTFTDSPITDPSMEEHGGGFEFGVCNLSKTRSHTLQSMTARIAALTAYSGSLSRWQACDDQMTSHHELTGGGCGGGLAGCICFRAVFSSSAVAGSEVDMVQTDASRNDPGDNLGKFPLALAPGKAIHLHV